MVDGASATAARFNVSGLIIGLTVVAFGTSAPELVVNLMASVHHHTDIVFGNILGSNIFNLFVILGVVAMISPFAVQRETIWKEIPISLVMTVLVLVLANGYWSQSGGVGLSRVEGGVLLLGFLLFVLYIIRQARAGEALTDVELPAYSVNRSVIYVLLGLAGLIIGGQVVVDHSVHIANRAEIPERIIGLTIVAVGTSLPELVTSVVAALKKQSDMAIGNIVGSNIFNLTLVLGGSATIFPVTYNTAFNIEFYLLMGGTMWVLMSMLTGQRKKMDRWEGGLLALVFIIYTVWMVMN